MVKRAGVKRAGLIAVLCRVATLTAAWWISTAATPRAADGTIHPGNDYPTAARAEYVFACMASNGQTQEALRQCSCSIDAIASILPYEKYEEAETVMRMRRSAGGYLGEVFRSRMSNTMLRDLREAQAEAEIRCF
jgi:hypothetical protein